MTSKFVQRPQANARIARTVRQPQTLSLMKRDEDKDTFDEVADMARSGYRLAKKLADLVNIETKCFFIAQTVLNPIPARFTNTPTWSGMTPVICNQIELGDTDFTRIGDSLKIQHFDLIFHQRGQQITANLGGLPQCRVIVFWDETNSTTLVNEVLEDAFVGTNIATQITKDWDEKASTKILYDHTWTPMTHVDTAATFITPYNHRHSMSINKHTQYEDTTSTIVTGALKLFFITNTAATVTIDWTTRCLFTDD